MLTEAANANLITDHLMLIKAANANLIKGICSDMCSGGVRCLQYVDDTILFYDKDPKFTTNLEWALICLEQVSGMRINYSKSELIPR
jgi:hypothetical protein